MHDPETWRLETLRLRRRIPPPLITVAPWFTPYPGFVKPMAVCHGPEITFFYHNDEPSLEAVIFHEAAHSMRWWQGRLGCGSRYAKFSPRYLMEEAIADHVSLAMVGDETILRDYPTLTPLRRKYLAHSVRSVLAAFETHGWTPILRARAIRLRDTVPVER